MGITDVQIGKYHNLRCDTAPWSITQQQTVFNLDEYPLGDPGDPTSYATEACEPQTESKSEVTCVLINFSNLYSGGTVNFSWYRSSDNILIYSGQYNIPDPSPGKYWQWFSVVSWVGKFTYELCEAGDYYCVITTPWGNRTVNFTCTSSSPCSSPGIEITDVKFITSDINPYPNCVGGKDENMAVELTIHMFEYHSPEWKIVLEKVPPYQYSTAIIDMSFEFIGTRTFRSLFDPIAFGWGTGNFTIKRVELRDWVTGQYLYTKYISPTPGVCTSLDVVDCTPIRSCTISVV